MKDERRKCGNCKHEHAWGILRHSLDGVPLYGARKCLSYRVYRGHKRRCNCEKFVQMVEGMENLPATTAEETKAIWAETSFLNAQVPMATRIMVRQIMSQAKGAGDTRALMAVFPEFAGLMISQITDIRGALVSDDNKFAHLVAHTDEIVESMRAVSQLAERLGNIYGAIRQIQDMEAKNREDIRGIARVLEKLAPELVEVKEPSYKAGVKDWAEFDNMWWGASAPDAYLGIADLDEARRMFLEKTDSLPNEPILTDADTLD
jgi:hypothetical protein